LSSRRISPVVAQTTRGRVAAGREGVRHVGVGDRDPRLGMSASAQSRSTMPCRRAASVPSVGFTSFARPCQRDLVGEKQRTDGEAPPRTTANSTIAELDAPYAVRCR